MDYESVFTTNSITEVKMPPGLKAPTKYIFSVTYADPNALSIQRFSEALAAALAKDSSALASYPPYQGHVGMREFISQNLMNRRRVETNIDSIFLSGGAAGAIQSIIDVLIDPGDIVLVEEFCYLGTIKMLLQRQAHVIHIGTDLEGIQTDILAETIKSLVAKNKKPKLIYTIPVYQNPMGMTMSLKRRIELVDIAQRYQIPILENESYADFRIDGPILPDTLMSIDNQNSVMYVSAYTKLLGCGLRLGYGVLPQQMISKLASIDFGPSPSHLSSIAVHEYLSRHMDNHITLVTKSLKAKRDAMISALDEYFPSSCTWNHPTGGMMIWMRLPEGADTWKVLDKAVENNVKYNPGPVFRADREGSNYIRLTYSHNSPQEINEGISILADVFDREGIFNPKT